MIGLRPALATSLVVLWGAFAARPAQAAPAKVAHVLELGADFDDMAVAQAMTSLLKLQVGDGGDFSLASDGPNLLVIAPAVRCDTRRFLSPPFAPDADRDINGRCLRSLGAHLGAKNYFWGFVYHGGGERLGVKLHLWTADRGDRSKALMIDGGGRERLAARLYEHLVHPERAADVRLGGTEVGVSGDGAELFVDGRPAGRYGEGDEVTVRAGEHEFELQREGKAVARAKAAVAAGRANEVRLEKVGAAGGGVDAARPAAASVERASDWRRGAGFIALGVGAAGLAGAGVFFALRQNENGRYEELCERRSSCSDEGEAALDRSRRWGTFSLVSLAAGVASVGVGTYFLLTTAPGPKRGATTARVRFGAAPLAGGAFTSLTVEALLERLALGVLSPR
jgi:hypothetical protein